MESDKSLDILGLKPVSEAISKVTVGTIDGAKAFLSRVCLPAAEEFGLLLQDHVRTWRANRATELARKAEEKVKHHHKDRDVKLSPRIAHEVFEEGSWIEDEATHSMWAGLLASSCTADGTDDSNIIFTSILKQMTSMQARILRYSVETAEKYLSAGGWPCARPLIRSSAEMMEICQCDDVMRIDRELDHLRALELIETGFENSQETADITPLSLALHLYVRAEGFPGSPIEYWGLKRRDHKEMDDEDYQF